MIDNTHIWPTSYTCSSCPYMTGVGGMVAELSLDEVCELLLLVLELLWLEELDH